MVFFVPFFALYSQPMIHLHPAQPLHSKQIDALRLFYLVNSAATAYWKLVNHFGSAQSALSATVPAWQALTIHKNHLTNLKRYRADSSQLSRAIDICLLALDNQHYSILFATDIHYPKQLDVLADKPPILFYRGDKRALTQAQIAMVGTRKPSQAARDICEQFAYTFAQEGLWVTSGLAEGIDKHAHLGALKQARGRTVAVLGNGITGCYPRQNQPLYDAIVAQGGVVISEFLPDAKPLAHNFPRRNRIVSGLSLATVVVEAAVKSGSLITASQAAEQGKTVFAIPGHIYNTQAKGCHQLIRDGAILVDAPEQVIEDINLPRRLHDDAHHSPSTAINEIAPSTNQAEQPNRTQQNTQLQAQQTHQTQAAKGNATPANTAPIQAAQVDMFAAPIQAVNHQQTMPESSNTQTPETAQVSVMASSNGVDSNTLPSHLDRLLSVLDWVGQDMDKLIATSQLDVAELSSQLMELELHGLVVQQGGLYLRCRP